MMKEENLHKLQINILRFPIKITIKIKGHNSFERSPQIRWENGTAAEFIGETRHAASNNINYGMHSPLSKHLITQIYSKLSSFTSLFSNISHS